MRTITTLVASCMLVCAASALGQTTQVPAPPDDERVPTSEGDGPELAAPLQQPDVGEPAEKVTTTTAAAETGTISEDGGKRKVIRVAVYDLELSDVPDRIGRVVTDSVLIELRKHRGVGVVGMKEIQAMLDLEAQKQIIGCDDESCLAEIAGALGVDVLVIGSIAQVGDERVLGLRRIDQRDAKIVGTYQQRIVAGDGSELLATVGPAVKELFADLELREGQTRGVDEKVALTLNPPPLDPWVFWSGVAVTSSLAGAGLGLLGINALAWSDFNTYVDSGRASAGVALSLRELEAKQGAINLSAATGIGAVSAALVLGSATGVVALFTDFWGYRAGASE